MSFIDDYLYVGTTFGCLFVIDLSSRHVVTVCRPYAGSELSEIVPLKSQINADLADVASDRIFCDDANLNRFELARSSTSSASSHRRPLFVTIGRGYIDLASIVVSCDNPKPSWREGLEHQTVMITWTGDTWPMRTASKC